jgi:hypothetical protein
MGHSRTLAHRVVISLRAYDGYRDVRPHECKEYGPGTRSAMPFKHEEI